MIKYAVVEVKYKKESEDRYESFKIKAWAWNIPDIKEAEKCRMDYLLSSSWKPDAQNMQVISYKT